MKAFILVISILFFMGCESVQNSFSQKSAKEKCEETPCTDSLCLHWSDSLQRCGTESALMKEQDRKKSEIVYMFKAIEDSAEIKQLESINKYLEKKNSLMKEILNKLKENKENTDSIYYQIRINNFCRDVKNTPLLMKVKNTLCKSEDICNKTVYKKNI